MVRKNAKHWHIQLDGTGETTTYDESMAKAIVKAFNKDGIYVKAEKCSAWECNKG